MSYMDYEKLFTRQAIESLKEKEHLDLEEYSLKLDYHQHELKIQALMNKFFEDNVNYKIIEEHHNKIEKFQGHNILIIKDLKKSIKQVNKHIIKRLTQNYPSLTTDKIIEVFLNDFITKFDKIGNSNYKLNKLYFDLSEKRASINIDKNTIIQENYQVLDLKVFSKNKGILIKEKKLIYNSKEEYIDFALYIGGLPMYGIEVKTPREGLRKALEDVQTKNTYGFFQIIAGTDGTNVFLTSNYKTHNLFKWKNYGDNNKITGIGLIDFSRELLFDINNSMFYLYHGLIKSNDKHKKILINLRVQQYFVTKKIDKDFKLLLEQRKNNTFKPYNKYLKHHTRTGKSLTFKSVAMLVFSKYTELYDKIIIFTHDVSSVMSSIIKEFGETKFNGKEIAVIKNKTDYKRQILNEDFKGMFIVNMQKIDNSSKKIIKSNKILCLIDEVHTHQTGSLANVREIQLPNASYLSATATPKLSKKDKTWIKKNFKAENGYEPSEEVVETIYENNINDDTANSKGEMIDEMTPSVAEDLGIITHLKVIKHKWNAKVHTDFKKLEEYVSKRLMNDFLKEDFLEETIKDLIENTKSEKKDLMYITQEYTDFLNLNFKEVLEKKKLYKNNNESKKYVLMNILLSRLYRIYSKFENSEKTKIKNILIEDFKLSMLDKKLEIIKKETKLIKKYIEEKYTPKFFWVVENVSEAIAIIKKMKKNIAIKLSNCADETLWNVEQNIYDGIRYAIDVSDLTDKDKDKEEVKKLKDKYGIDYEDKNINGKVIYSKNKEPNIIEDFENTGPGSVDVLILVKKRMMGYDNKNLTAVFLDKNIRDIKLMTQISTRATTMKEGKEVGYLIDLTLTNDNIDIFKSAYALYDDNKKQKTIISEEFLEEIYSSIENNIKGIKNLFSKEKKPFKENLNWYATKVIAAYETSSKNNTSSNYMNYIKSLNENIKDLINPKFQFNHDGKKELYEEYNNLLKINAKLYLYILNKESALGDIGVIKYTKKEIREIIEELFINFKKDINDAVSKVENLISISGNTRQSVTNNSEEVIQFNNTKVYKYLAKLRKEDNDISVEAFSYFDKLVKRIEEDIEVTYEDYEEASKKYEEFQRNKKIIINENYDGEEGYYIADSVLVKFFKDDIIKYKDTEKELKDFIKMIAKYINFKTKKIYLTHKDLHGKDLINQIIKELQIKSIQLILDYAKTIEGSEVNIDSIKKLKIKNNDFWHKESYPRIYESYKIFEIIEKITIAYE